MTEESNMNERSQEWAPAGRHSSWAVKPGRDGLELDRLPPPAFPPGSRRSALRPLTPSRTEKGRASLAPDNAERARPDPATEDDTFASALNSSDEPLRGRPSGPSGDRAPDRAHRSVPSAMAEFETGDDAELGVATGMGVAPPASGALDVGDAVQRAAESLQSLASALREQGPAGLQAGPDASRFEAVLRGFIAGYLASLDPEGKPTR
jgi:hypothetical protein